MPGSIFSAEIEEKPRRKWLRGGFRPLQWIVPGSPFLLTALALGHPGSMGTLAALAAAVLGSLGAAMERGLCFAEATHTVMLYYGRSEA